MLAVASSNRITWAWSGSPLNCSQDEEQLRVAGQAPSSASGAGLGRLLHHQGDSANGKWQTNGFDNIFLI